MEFSSENWFFLKQLNNYLELAVATPTLREDFGDLENEVFERWNQSEFADLFLRFLNRGTTLKEASGKSLRVLDDHLTTLGSRLILKQDSLHKNYRLQSSLGEYKLSKGIGRLLQTTLHLDGKDLNLKTRTLKDMNRFSQRIDVALKVIQRHSPTSWERFKAFSDTIIPIAQKEFVSYSHQELPGVSMINLYDRDFVDLMDDLLHENGHHHLNAYLNLEKLIEEPIETIFYSPWRRTLRPLRGIYHAYFTFFWAFKLFSDLSSAKDPDSIWYVFKPDEKAKIHARAVEEFLMLEYVFGDLNWARKQGLIFEKGWNLIEAQHRELRKYSKKIPQWEKQAGSYRRELKDLRKTLRLAKKKYLKTV